MRLVIASILLSLLGFLLVKPILPYFEYVFNYTYIAEVLCINKAKPEMHCNGQCHLSDQLDEAWEASSPVSSNNPETRFEVKEIDLFAHKNPCMYSPFGKHQKHSDPFRIHYEGIYQTVPSPPPKS